MEGVSSPLLSHIEGVLAGSGEVEQLGELIEFTQRDLAAVQADFQAALARENENTRRAVVREIQAVEQSFQDYHAVLASVTGYLQSFDKSYLESALANLPLAIVRMDLDFLAYREATLAERGPTTHAGINALCALMAWILSGEDRQEELESQLDLEFVRAETVLQNPPGDGLAALRHQFYQEYLEHLQAFPDPPERSWLDGLLALGRSYARLDLAALERRFAWGPTSLPALNLVINSVWLWSQQRMATEVCALLLQEAHAFLLEILESHEQLAAADDSALDAVSDASAALECLLDQLEGYQAFLDSSGENLDELAGRTIAAARDLATAREALQGTGVAPTVPCIICGLANPAGSSRCTQCGSRLSAGGFEMAEEATPGSGEPARVQRLLETAEQLMEGFGEPDELLALVREMQQSLVVARKKAAPPDEVGESLAQTARDYAQALDEIEEGLKLLGEFAADPDREALARARASVLSGAEKLQAVQQALAASS